MPGKLWFALGRLYESTKRGDKAREVYRDIQKEFAGKPEASEAQVKLAGMDWGRERLKTPSDRSRRS